MAMQTEPLHALAEAAGLQREWRDVDGCEHVVRDATLVTILEALGHKARTPRQIAASLGALEKRMAQLPPLVVADAGAPIVLPITCERAECASENSPPFLLEINEGVPRAPAEPGYYECTIDGVETRLAVSPVQCPLPPPGERRRWGVSLQIPSLRSSRASAFGGFAELAEAVETLAGAGADVVAINPVHALFPGDGARFSPYSPSSRRFFNGAMADPALAGLPPLPEESGGELIAWESALPERHAQLRAIYAGLSQTERDRIVGEPGEALRRHATYDALAEHFRAQGLHGWRQWPARYRKPDGKAVATFAEKNREDVAFHLFVQALALAGLAKVQQGATAAGMSIGLVGDLAVGVDPGGSDSWMLGDVMLQGLTIGAPPDPFGPQGQNWALTSFSPEGLRRSGYAPWIAMIRAAMRHGGGLRIDHAFGLARLWVIPAGAESKEGAYLTYPFEDLVRLLTLEAHLAECFVIAEDLGTAPHGFSEAIARRNILGMRVLWFERAADHGFIGAQDYDALAAAMSGTHDTPTLAGWWSGADLDWADKLGRMPADVDRAKAEKIRDWDRGLLWSTMAGDVPRPAPFEPHAAVDAAIAHIAATSSLLAILPVEDLLGLVEQPNLPGTTVEHPNWRRRLAAPLDDMLGDAGMARRLAVLGSPHTAA